VISGTVDANTVGSYTLTYTATDPANNVGTATRTVNVVDTTKPVITITGANPATVECHTSYTDAGATALDSCAGPVSVTTSGSVDVNTTGSYTITYTATDPSGNTQTATRTVNVSDSTPPTVTLNGAATVTVECHTSYTEAGATASDTCAGTLSVVISGTVDANTVGSYTLTYTATDPANNVGTATRTVNVVDTTAPAINCPANILNVFTTSTSGTNVTYTNPTATDNCDPNPSVVCLPASGSLFAVGTSTVTCTATDASGNHSACQFTITVVLNHAPVVVDNNMGAMQNHTCAVKIEKLLADDWDEDDDTLTISSVSPSSLHGGTLSLTATTIVYAPATGFVGTDSFTYMVSDGRGGTAMATVTVQVYSENDPTVNSIGAITLVDGHIHVRFAGIPGFTYEMQRAPGFSGPWATIGSFTVPDNGLVEFVDPDSPAGTAFYRTAMP
jgi:hypothetical protein